MDFPSDPRENLKYPKTIWLIVLNEFCERFSYYGLKTVLVLYLTTILKFNGDESTMIYHSFVFLAYFMPLPGAILADSCWGRYKTIIRLSIVYALGNVILAGSSLADVYGLDIQKLVTLLGLLFIAIGTGGIKPCVFAFGGDQFRLPQQEELLLKFTTKFMIAVNVGALISTFLTPELRHGVHCFGKKTCFPLAFGVPAVFMLCAIAIFVSGKNSYVKKKPEQNAISRTFGCIFYALRTKIFSSVPNTTHWLDNAKGVYTETEITETKTALGVISVFVTFPIFYALYEQQSSRWTLQATLMDGRIDFLDWTIKPDQMITIIPFLGVTFLILFDYTLYPLIAMVGIRKPLQKLTLSGFLAVIAFILAALLQYKIFGKTTVIPTGEGRFNIYNGFDCNVSVRSPSLKLDHIGPLEMISNNYRPMALEDKIEIALHIDRASCSSISENVELNTSIAVIKGKTISYYLTRSNLNTTLLNRVSYYDNTIKDKYGNPSLRLLIDHSFKSNDNIKLINEDESSFNSYSFSSFGGMDFNAVKVGKYNLFYNGEQIYESLNFIPATLYTLTVQRNVNRTDVRLFSMDEGNFLHISWQLPQFVCMIVADVIFIVNSSEISFSEAPTKMKSFTSAISLLTASLGNLFVVFISALSIKNQVYEYLLYSGFMFADSLLLAYFSITYRKPLLNQ